MGSSDGHEDDNFFRRPPPASRAARTVMTDPSNDPTPDEALPAAELLPAVYAELRRVAAVLTVRLRPGQTLQPTALVHEAYLRLVRHRDPGWEGRRHFFGAAARAMREILIEQARRKGSHKPRASSRSSSFRRGRSSA